MLKSKAFIFLISFFVVTQVHASDSTKVLSFNAFVRIVQCYHPVIKQADVRTQRAEAEILQARGVFDPVLSYQYDGKTFTGKNYFDYSTGEISIPTWYGLSFKAGMQNVEGDFTNPELTFGKSTYAGIKLKLNELVFDKRRATLLQAKNLRNVAAAERNVVANEVLFDAIDAYWNWVRVYKVFEIIKSVTVNSEERIRFVRIEYEQGLRPAIDTVETLIQLQSLYAQQNDAWLQFQNAGWELSNFLWSDKEENFQWSNDILPDNSIEEINTKENSIPAVEEMLAMAARHPKIVSVQSQLEVLQIERRLKAQAFLPGVSVNSNLLTKGYRLPSYYNKSFIPNNNKLSIDVSIPLFMREARGAYKASKLKLDETNFKQMQLVREIENKVKQYHNGVNNLLQQINLCESAYRNYEKLYNAEKFRFQTGESTLFLLNARENKLIESAQKLVELKAKWHKQYAGLFLAAGKLLNL